MKNFLQADVSARTLHGSWGMLRSRPYLPSDGEGLRSVGRAGDFERGPLGHLLLGIDDHRFARTRAAIL